MSTPFLDKVYQQIDFDRELVFKFFTIFSLFEYALKSTGFYTLGRSNEALPNWAGFARSIQPQFNPTATAELASAVNYMFNYPVMKQIIDNNSLAFVQRTRPGNISDIEWLSVLIRGVRNNLFHGGKFSYKRPRDPKLIMSTLLILENWSQCNADVKNALNQIG